MREHTQFVYMWVSFQMWISRCYRSTLNWATGVNEKYLTCVSPPILEFSVWYWSLLTDMLSCRVFKQCPSCLQLQEPQSGSRRRWPPPEPMPSSWWRPASTRARWTAAPSYSTSRRSAGGPTHMFSLTPPTKTAHRLIMLVLASWGHDAYAGIWKWAEIVCFKHNLKTTQKDLNPFFNLTESAFEMIQL